MEFPRKALCGLLLLTAWGCQRGDRLELLRLSEARPQELEPPGQLLLIGSGFPAGRPCEVQLTGRAYRPGARVRSVDATLECKAATGELIETPIDAESLKALGGFGSFDLIARVSFIAKQGETRVDGVLKKVRLDLVEPTAAHLAAREARSARARQIAEFLGMVVGETQVDPAGLVVQKVRLGSRALAAGLEPQDVIAELSSIRVRSLSDLVPPPDASEIALRVLRPARNEEFYARLSLRGLDASTTGASRIYLGSLAILILLCLAARSRIRRFISRILPIKLRAGFFARPPSAPEPAHRPSSVFPALLGPAAESTDRRGRPARIITRCLAPLSAGALLVAMAYSRFLVGKAADPVLICLLPAALRVAMALSSRERRLSWPALRSLGAELGRAASYLTPIACACALGGSCSLDVIVALQGAYPWQWLVFQNPAFLLAFPLYLASCRNRSRVVDRRAERADLAFSRLVEMFESVLLCGIGAAVFLGGWQIAAFGYLEPPWARFWGALVFLAKALAIGYLGSAPGWLPFGFEMNKWARAILVMTTPALTALWIALQAPARIDAAFGYVLFAATLAAAVIFVRLSDRNRPMVLARFSRPRLENASDA